LYGDFREGSGYNLTKKLLRTRRKITALVSCNMMMSMGCLRAFEETGTKVPDDIAFISFDDLPYFSFPTYNISAVHNPARQLGMEAARILLGKMKKSRQHRNVMVTRTVLNTKLILRGSEKLRKP
jgi:DNA-binding LacI/PurR family transcriptional regulator